jgi:alpha-L-rhamnosidase
MVLGVYPTSDGYDTVRIKPEVKSLPINWARGSVPTVKGEINVDWSLYATFFSMQVTLPEGVTATVILPDGTVVEGVSGSQKITCDISK